MIKHLHFTELDLKQGIFLVIENAHILVPTAALALH